jgi:hypothetical protein
MRGGGRGGGARPTTAMNEGDISFMFGAHAFSTRK